METSEVITSIRKKKGLNQTDFAKLIGLTQASLSHIESNKKKPNPSTIAKICVALEIPISWFDFLTEDGKDLTGSAKARFEVMGEEIKKMLLDSI